MADWKSSDLCQLLTGETRDNLVTKKGKESKVADLQGKVVGVYHSASWCGPCRAFTPWLSAFYKAVKKAGHRFEIVWISADRDEKAYRRYFKKMPWKAVPFEDRKTVIKGSKFIPGGLPGLALFNTEGKVYNLSARTLLRTQGISGFPWTEETKVSASDVEAGDVFDVVKTDEEWKSQLTAEEYAVIRGKATQAAGKGKYVNSLPTKGYYKCRACGLPLYSAQSKFDAGCGWPAFDACYAGAVKTRTDTSHGMTRIEIVCGRCSGHLGHVFSGEGFTDTDERHCVNSISMVYDSNKPPKGLTEQVLTLALAQSEKKQEEKGEEKEKEKDAPAEEAAPAAAGEAAPAAAPAPAAEEEAAAAAAQS